MSDIPRGVTTAYNAGSHDSGLLDGIFHALVHQVNNHLAPAWRWKLLALHQQREGLYGVVHFSKGDLVLQLFVYDVSVPPAESNAAGQLCGADCHGVETLNTVRQHCRKCSRGSHPRMKLCGFA